MTTSIYTLSLHDALPILNRLTPPSLPYRPAVIGPMMALCRQEEKVIGAKAKQSEDRAGSGSDSAGGNSPYGEPHNTDRKSTRLNSSHGYTSYAVFCLKKK